MLKTCVVSRVDVTDRAVEIETDPAEGA